MRIENGRYSAGEFHERWGLAGSGFSRKRIFTDKINFSRPFENPPKVLIAISGFDISDAGESFRASLDVQAARITAEGFTVQLNAYEASRVRSLTVDWLAIGA
jgi:H-type lectin domain